MNIPAANRKKGAAPLNPRENVLAQWRRLDLSADEKARATSARGMSDVMPGVLRKLKLDQRQVEAEIVKVWSHLMDPHVTEHARPTGFHKGTLFVSVDSNVWLDEIVRYRRKEILDRLQHSFGRDKIVRLSFRVG